MIKILLLSILISSLSFSQELEREFFSFKDGLPDNSIRQINQDKYGYLWIRTNSSIARFDGKTFSRVKTFDYKLFQEIIFLNDFIYLNDLNNIRRFHLSDSSEKLAKIDRSFKLKVDKIFETDSTGEFYVYRNDSLFKFTEKNNQLGFLDKIKNLEAVYLRDKSIIYSDDKAVYIKTGDYLEKLHGEKAQQIKNYQNRIVAVSNGKIVDLAFKANLHKSKNDQYYVNKSLIVSYNKSKIKINTSEGNVFVEELFNNVTCIFYDKEQTLFVGTEDGLFHFPNLKNIHYKSFNNVTSIAESEEYLFAIIKHKKIFKINLKTMKSNEVKVKNLDSFIYRVKNYKNNIYVLGSNYLYKNFKRHQKVNSFATLFSISDTVYLYDYSNKEFILIEGKRIPSLEETIRKKELIEIIEQKSNIVFRTKSNVLSFSKKDLMFKELSNVKSFRFYNKHGQKEFLFKKDSLIIKKENSEEIIADDIFIPEIFAKSKTYQDRFLFSTNEGLFEYRNKNFFKRFGQLNGLVHQSSLKKVDNFYIRGNKLYYFALSGLSIIDLDSIPKKPLSLYVNLFADNKAVKNDGEIPYSHKLLQFDFQLITHRYQRDVRYHYRILPIQTEWTTSRDNNVNLSHMPHGNYEFEIRAYNSERYGYYEKFRFTIQKPFWLEWWFLLSALMLIVFYYFLCNEAVFRKHFE